MTDPALEAMWKKVIDDWENDRAHEAFLRHCQSTDQLLEAAVRYRGMTGDRNRGPTAEKRLKGVAVLAMARLESQRTTHRRARRHAGRLVLILFFFSASVALLLYAAY